MYFATATMYFTVGKKSYGVTTVMIPTYGGGVGLNPNENLSRQDARSVKNLQAVTRNKQVTLYWEDPLAEWCDMLQIYYTAHSDGSAFSALYEKVTGDAGEPAGKAAASSNDIHLETVQRTDGKEGKGKTIGLPDGFPLENDTMYFFAVTPVKSGLGVQPGMEAYRALNWEPLGKNDIAPFTATYDGNDKAIEYLYINRSSLNAGLFGIVQFGAELKNIMVHSGSVLGGSIAGALCGLNRGTINCTVEQGVFVESSSVAGGLAGRNTNTIEDSHNYGTVYINPITNGEVAGGIAGDNWRGDSVIKNCTNASAVTAAQDAGGIAGSSEGTIVGSSNTGTITGTHYIGGVAGFNRGMITGKCFNTGRCC